MLKKGRFRIAGATGFSGAKIDRHCYGVLQEDSLKKAEKAVQDGLPVWHLEGQLRCECGATVGARPRSDGPGLRPTEHYPYKAPRKLQNPSGKPGYDKRSPR